MTILIKTKCSKLPEYLSLFIFQDFGVTKNYPTEVLLQKRFHIASCPICFDQAKTFIKQTRNFCPFLFEIPRYVYSVSKTPFLLTKKYQELEVEKMKPCKINSLQKHIKKCHCCSYWERIVENGWMPNLTVKKKFVVSLFPCDLFSAAGTTDLLGNIHVGVLEKKGFPQGTCIISTLKRDGYSIRVESPVPITLVMEFYKGSQMLEKVSISNEIPDKIVPCERIIGWTKLELYEVYDG
ncbi:hypothetical protein [Candidatus Uabimicrobium amorphum]|uniref:Uncharacterized protein n=1 Tax=Uabimicrobium amorphum TaxID=2596890 RepID=A0A5S9IMQ3_UABAM|nr:hypothetical protein [Candidatus Uabimicrobium amorphum]BBM84554.1 hypothetical protein UABAM_02915 [Candidatus Uabimicrobium amorphum]